MATKIALVSDDKDFFKYIKEKLAFRSADELYSFSFNEIPQKSHLLRSTVLIINSENARAKTLDLLTIMKGTPAIVMSYNEDENFKKECYKNGIFDFITILVNSEELRTRLIPALSVCALLEKNKQYRDILVHNAIISPNNEAYVNYDYILDKVLEDIRNNRKKAVFVAISPNDKTRYLLPSNLVETVLINNIRKNDLLINYAPSKYFLVLFDSNVGSAKKLWNTICSQTTQKLYAGFCNITNQGKQQLINEALNKLHEQIRNDICDDSILEKTENKLCNNFKLYKQEFNKKLEQVITPAFYQIQQKYANRLFGVTFQQGIGDGYGAFYIKGKTFTSNLRITSPGFAKINIDITLQKNKKNNETKRITIEPEELEIGFLEDILEQFVCEHKNLV